MECCKCFRRENSADMLHENMGMYLFCNTNEISYRSLSAYYKLTSVKSVILVEKMLQNIWRNKIQ